MRTLSRLVTSSVAACLLILGAASAGAQSHPQQPAPPTPAALEPAPVPDPGTEARMKALEDRIDQLEKRTETAEKRETEAQKELQRLRAERDTEMAAAAAEKKPEQDKSKKSEPVITVGGYVEAYYQWNVNDPSNRITNFRGFDNRHNTFTVSNAAIDAQGTFEGAMARVTLQIGHTPDTYYLAEPTSPGASGANASSKDLWKYVQQAYAGYEFPVLKGFALQAGIFLSPVGPESIAVKDSWNWSRSNLFFGLPFYHTGIHAALKVTDQWTVAGGVVNGWNSVVDNNPEKSFHARVTYAPSSNLSWTLLYFGGIERNDDVPEGDPWRSTFDTHLLWQATDWLALNPHFDSGFEPTELGTSYWVSGALASRFKMADWLFLALRADAFYEKAASNGAGEAGRIFWPVDWVTSQTATLEARLVDHVSFRLEYRHDHAAGDMFFAGEVEGDGDEAPFVPDARYQDTFTLGATAWF